MKNLSVLLNKKVTENDCNCEKCREHYSRGNLSNKYDIAETKKLDPPPKKKENVTVFTFLSKIKDPL